MEADGLCYSSVPVEMRDCWWREIRNGDGASTSTNVNRAYEDPPDDTSKTTASIIAKLQESRNHEYFEGQKLPS